MLSSGPILKKIKTNSLESRFGLLEDHDNQQQQEQSEKPNQQEDDESNPLKRRFQILQDPKPQTEAKGLLEKRTELETPKQHETPKNEGTTPLEQLAHSRAAEQNGKQDKTVEKPKKQSKSSKKNAEQTEEIEEEEEEGREFVIAATTEKGPAVTQETIPYWATAAYVRDKNMKRPSDANYDPSTLYVPEEEIKRMMPTMRQYWEFKSNNFDKIVLFKMGQFYELFYEDAIIGNKYLDLNWNNRRFSVGFREKTFEEQVTKLVKLGYKLAVIEQTETPDEMAERLKSSTTKIPKLLKREIKAIITAGTWTDGNFKNFDSTYLLSVLQDGERIGFCFFEPSLLELWHGVLDDDPEHRQLRTLLWQINPDEIVCNHECDEYKKMFAGLPKKPAISFFKSELAVAEEKYVFPIEITDSLILKSLKYMCSYLDYLLILDTVKQNFRFKEYTSINKGKAYLGLDHQALRHLEVFYTNMYTKFSRKGSLFEFLDRTVSGFGHRLLNRWVASPSNDVHTIFTRLDAIEDLENIRNVRETFQTKLATFPDIERIYIKMYKYIYRHEVTTHDDMPDIRFKDFKTMLEYVRVAESLIINFQERSADFKSARLFSLANYEEKGGIMPACQEKVDRILNMFEWNLPEPIPRVGVCEAYDEVMVEMKDIENDLDTILEGVREQFKDPTICYVHQKFPYQLEIAEKHVKGLKKPVNFMFTSSRPGFQRFYTEEIKEDINEIDNLKKLAQKALLAFVKDLYKIFREYASTWQRAIDVLAELDCLCSLSKLCYEAGRKHPMTRPNFISSSTPCLNVQEMVHPCLVKNGVNFVPISIDFNIKKFSHPEIILLTGPNMGGKSTTLRTLGIITILAHMGCYVPALSCELSLIDSIFTRMGSRETLCEGKSSFYIELEETLNILKNSTENSLVLVDELGKGTSTFDGVAIAYAVLKNIIEEKACRGIFTTHYHLLTKEFENDRRLNLYHMAYSIDHASGNIQFEYKLKKGACDKSHGILLAKTIFEKTGVSETIIEQADAMSTEFENCDEKFKKVLKLIDF